MSVPYHEDFFHITNKIRMLKKTHKAIGKLPMAEFHMLAVIDRLLEGEQGCQGVTATQLMQEQELTVSGTSKMLGILEKKGYIRREPGREDRRVYYITITPSGERLLRAQKLKRDSLIEKVVARMGEQRVEEFIEDLEIIYEIMKEEWEGDHHG